MRSRGRYLGMLLLIAAAAGSVALLFMRNGPARHITAGVADYFKEDRFTGRVFNAVTGDAVTDAVVYVRTDGWDPLRGKGWEASRSATDTTDGAGAFNLGYHRLSSGTDAVVMRSGFSPMPLHEVPTTFTSIPLRRLVGDPEDVLSALIAIPRLEPERVLYIDLWDISLRESPDSADIAIRLIADIEPRLIVTSLGLGGVLRHDYEMRFGVIDSVALECLAPVDGYGRADTTMVPGERTLYFVRLRGGKHFARFVLSPRQLLRNSQRATGLGTSAIVWVNSAGGRGLCGPDPAVESILAVAGEHLRSSQQGTIGFPRTRGRRINEALP